MTTRDPESHNLSPEPALLDRLARGPDPASEDRSTRTIGASGSATPGRRAELVGRDGD